MAMLIITSGGRHASQFDGTINEAVGKDANRLHKDAFTAAFKVVFSIDTDIDILDHHGHTDPLVLVKVNSIAGWATPEQPTCGQQRLITC
jgi:hypothetical protein